ncbi:MAG: NADH-quinone oxidoreductase subunit NuoE [Sedimentisphaerales bacterium]|jgi:NADH-quinone oxidoreductase subunit E
MFTKEEQKEIAVELGKYPVKSAAGLEVLKIVQKYRGWISDESLSEVAQLVEMTDDELDSVASSYNHIFRKPVGRHIIFICDGMACWIKGYENIIEHFRNRLGITPGQTTTDGRFTLLPSSCLGVCEKAPVMIVDDDLYVELDSAKVDEILNKYR